MYEQKKPTKSCINLVKLCNCVSEDVRGGWQTLRSKKQLKYAPSIFLDAPFLLPTPTHAKTVIFPQATPPSDCRCDGNKCYPHLPQKYSMGTLHPSYIFSHPPLVLQPYHKNTHLTFTHHRISRTLKILPIHGSRQTSQHAQSKNALDT